MGKTFIVLLLPALDGLHRTIYHHCLTVLSLPTLLLLEFQEQCFLGVRFLCKGLPHTAFRVFPSSGSSGFALPLRPFSNFVSPTSRMRLRLMCPLLVGCCQMSESVVGLQGRLAGTHGLAQEAVIW